MNRDKVRGILETWLEGSLDSHDWDYFISVKNRDSALEEIRQRAGEIWVQNSEFLLPGAINPCELSALGRSEVTEMLSTMKVD